MAMIVTTGSVMKLIGAIEQVLATDGILDAKGDFAAPVSPQAIAKAAAEIEQLLVTDGVIVPGNVDKIIQLIPLILALVGVN